MSKKESNDAGPEAPEQNVDNEVEIVDAEIIESEPQVTARQSDPKKGSGRIALVLAIIAIIGVAAGLGYGYQQLKLLQDSLLNIDQSMAAAGQQQDGLKSSLTTTQSAFEEQKKNIEAQRLALQAQDEKLSKEREVITQQGVEMKQTLESVYQRVGRSSTAWMAAEAEYLMRVANHRLRLERDFKTAALALEAADSRLRDTGDPGWISIRELIAEEIASLKAIGQLDRSGLSAKLISLAKQAKALKLMGLQYTPAQPEGVKAAATQEERSLKTLLDDGWSGFKSLMVIRHRDKPVAAMLAPEQQFFVHQNLELQLEAARMAMLRGDRVLFETSLQMTERWIGDFFDVEATPTKAILQELGSLKGVDVNPELPDISRSLVALHERQKAAEREGRAK